MALEESDRQTLARVLADAMPSWADREAVASRAGLSDVQLAGDPEPAWRLLVDEADARGKVGKLTRVACRLKPSDTRLASLADAVEQGRPLSVPDTTLRIVAGVVAVLALLAIGLGVMSSRGNPEPAPPAPIAGDDGGLAAKAPVRSPVPQRELKAPPEQTPSPTPPPAQTPAPVATPEPTPEPVALGKAFGTTDVCKGQRGFAYMGTSIGRLERGDVWTAPRYLNVRADYPRKDNAYEKRAPVQCVLPEKWRVQLVEGPIAVDGGAYWVEVRGEWIAKKKWVPPPSE